MQDTPDVVRVDCTEAIRVVRKRRTTQRTTRANVGLRAAVDEALMPKAELQRVAWERPDGVWLSA